jgi:hypothetical protein
MFLKDQVIPMVGKELRLSDLEYVFSEILRKQTHISKYPLIRQPMGFLDLGVKVYGMNLLTGVLTQDVVSEYRDLKTIPAQHVTFSNKLSIMCSRDTQCLTDKLQYSLLKEGLALYDGVKVKKVDIQGNLPMAGIVVPVLGNVLIQSVFFKTLARRR